MLNPFSKADCYLKLIRASPCHWIWWKQVFTSAWCRSGVCLLLWEQFLWPSWSTTEFSDWENLPSGWRDLALTVLLEWDSSSLGKSSVPFKHFLVKMYFFPCAFLKLMLSLLTPNFCLFTHCIFHVDYSTRWALCLKYFALYIMGIVGNDVCNCKGICAIYFCRCSGTGIDLLPHAEDGSCGISPSMETRSSNLHSSVSCLPEHLFSQHFCGPSSTQVRNIANT